jgi:DMSO/TMAO reductase YedYZ heme-binding membrane subunit
MTLSSEEMKANVARRDERRRYVRHYLWNYAPPFILLVNVIQWALRPAPFSAASIKKAVILTILTTVIGVPWYAQRLGKRWDKLHRDGRGH